MLAAKGARVVPSKDASILGLSVVEVSMRGCSIESSTRECGLPRCRPEEEEGWRHRPAEEEEGMLPRVRYEDRGTSNVCVRATHVRIERKNGARREGGSRERKEGGTNNKTKQRKRETERQGRGRRPAHKNPERDP
jgi:hypothetical protein